MYSTGVSNMIACKKNDTAVETKMTNPEKILTLKTNPLIT